MKFDKYNLNATLLNNINTLNFQSMTNIQSQVIEHIFNGQDLLAIAQTGSGKTAAYLIPIINELVKQENNNQINCIILVPTRDLVNQVYDTFINLSKKLKINICKVMGGIDKQNQINELKTRTNVIVGVLGRFKELLHKKVIDLNNIKYLVIDEFDKMLDLGFRKDILGLIQILKDKKIDYQTLLFSATNPTDTSNLIQVCLRQNYQCVICEEEKTINDLINQQFFIMHKSWILKWLLQIIYEHNEQTIIFVNTINECKTLENLLRYMNLKVQAIHGDRSQNNRDKIINDFKQTKFSILIATDVLSRGIDIKSLKLIINYNLPENIETYIHRSGRVGRNNCQGNVISLCKLEEKEKVNKIIEKYHLEANILSKDEWQKPNEQQLKDVINFYYNKMN